MHRLSYCAGILDGEGYFGITKHKDPTRTQGYHYEYVVQVMMYDKAPIKILCDVFKIKMIRLERKSYRKPMYVMTARIKNAERVLNVIYPYLIGKKPQAKLLLQFAKLRKNWKQYRIFIESEKVKSGQLVPRMKVTDEYLQKCESLYQQCKMLKSRNSRYTNHKIGIDLHAT